MKKILIVLILISLFGCGNDRSGTSEQARLEEGQKVQQEITALLEKQERAATARTGRKAFRITRSRIYIHKEESGVNQPIVELDAANNTGQPVSKAYFRGLLAVPGKAKPRYQDSFSYHFPSALGPKERVHWNIPLDLSSSCANIQIPEGAVFTVEVTGLERADGEPLFADDFSDNEEKRLYELLDKYPEYR